MNMQDWVKGSLWSAVVLTLGYAFQRPFRDLKRTTLYL
jgi:hypothetical protein